MFPEDKLNAIRNYIIEMFPDVELNDHTDENYCRKFNMYRLGMAQHIYIERKFIDDRNSMQISDFLNSNKSTIYDCIVTRNATNIYITDKSIYTK